MWIIWLHKVTVKKNCEKKMYKKKLLLKNFNFELKQFEVIGFAH